MATTHANLKTLARIDPINAPMPALLAERKSAPPRYSPMNAPMRGAIKIQIICGGIRIPTNTPMNAPKQPRHVAPNFFAPTHDKTKSTICAKHVIAKHIPMKVQPIGDSGMANL